MENDFTADDAVRIMNAAIERMRDKETVEAGELKSIAVEKIKEAADKGYDNILIDFKKPIAWNVYVKLMSSLRGFKVTDDSLASGRMRIGWGK